MDMYMYQRRNGWMDGWEIDIKILYCPPLILSLFLHVVLIVTTGLNAGKLRELLREAMRNIPAFPDWLNDDLRQSKGWPTFQEAIVAVHNPGKRQRTNDGDDVFWSSSLSSQLLLCGCGMSSSATLPSLPPSLFLESYTLVLFPTILLIHKKTHTHIMHARVHFSTKRASLTWTPMQKPDNGWPLTN